MSLRYPADLGGGGERSNASRLPQKDGFISATNHIEKSSCPPNACSQKGFRRVASHVSQKSCGGSLDSRMIDESIKQNARKGIQNLPKQPSSTLSTTKSSSCTPSNIPIKCKVITHESNKSFQKPRLTQNQNRLLRFKNMREAGLTNEPPGDSSVLHHTSESKQQRSKECQQSHTAHEKRINCTMSRNFSQTSESAPPSSKLLVQAKIINEHASSTPAEEASTHQEMDSEKSEAQLPPLKMLKTPDPMRQFVTRIVESQISNECPQFKRRFFVKLPPLSKKAEEILVNGPKFTTVRKFGTDRKIVSSRKLSDGRGVSVLKNGNVPKVGNEQQTKIKSRNSQAKF